MITFEQFKSLRTLSQNWMRVNAIENIILSYLGELDLSEFDVIKFTYSLLIGYVCPLDLGAKIIKERKVDLIEFRKVENEWIKMLELILK